MTGAFVLPCGLLLVTLGIGIALSKKFHIIVAPLAVIAGVLFALAVFLSVGMLGFFGWIGFMITCLALGGLTHKQKS